jgi:hypothetical protein
MCVCVCVCVCVPIAHIPSCLFVCICMCCLTWLSCVINNHQRCLLTCYSTPKPTHPSIHPHTHTPTHPYTPTLQGMHSLSTLARSHEGKRSPRGLLSPRRGFQVTGSSSNVEIRSHNHRLVSPHSDTHTTPPSTMLTSGGLTSTTTTTASTLPSAAAVSAQQAQASAGTSGSGTRPRSTSINDVATLRAGEEADAAAQASQLRRQYRESLMWYVCVCVCVYVCVYVCMCMYAVHTTLENLCAFAVSHSLINVCSLFVRCSNGARSMVFGFISLSLLNSLDLS